MNLVKVFQSSLIGIVILNMLSITSAVSSDQQKVNTTSREANAQKQLLDHQRYMDSTQNAKFKMPTAFSSNVSHPFKKIQSSSTIFFQDDMESGVNGWTVVSPTDSAAWHLSTRSYNSWSHSWHAGTESGTYQADARVYDELISPQINLSGAIGQVTLLFEEYYYTELGWDFCMVDVTTDGGSNWTHLRGGYGESVSGENHFWKTSHLDLTPYSNQTINLRFVFDTGDSLYNYFEGWYIDDVIVFDQTAWVTGTAFFDQNQNGIHEAGESTITDLFPTYIDSPIRISLMWYDDSTFNLPLPLGSYFIVLTDHNFDNWFHPWLTTTPETLTVNLSMAGKIDTIDVGYYRPPCILCGRAFQDLNHNGNYNNGEPALTEPVIELEDANFNLLAQTHADLTGQFSFEVPVTDVNWRGGSKWYWVALYGLSANWIPTTPDPFSRSPKYYVNVGARDTLVTGLDFGSYLSHQVENGTIKGYVFNDLNGNGVQDSLEPMMSHCSVMLMCSDGELGNIYGRTDSLGKFSFTGLPSGRYGVMLYGYVGVPYGWQQSLPASPFTNYYFQLGSDEVRDSVIFGTYHLSVGTVRGHIFYDMNRNGIENPGERYPQPGVTIQGPNSSWSLSVIADREGNYSVDTLPVGEHTISVGLPGGTSMQQWRSIPPNPVVFTLDSSQTDTINWIMYTIVPSSVSGTLYDDLNGNGVRDSGETPIKGATISMNWDIYYGYGEYNSSTITDDSGKFRFYPVWKGYYVLQIPMSAGWRQTEPASWQPYNVTVNDEENLIGFDFGVTRDTTFNIAFRTFLPESLITDVYDNNGKLCKPMPTKPIGCEEIFKLVVPKGGLNGLHVQFNTGSRPLDSLSATHFPPPIPFTQKYKWDFKLTGDDTLAEGDTITIFARWTAGKIFRINRYWWEDNSSTPADSTTIMRTLWAEQTRYLYAIPNLVNVFQSKPGSGSKIRITNLNIGLVPGPYSVSISTKGYKNIWASLTDRYGNTHKGRPRCLDMASSIRTGRGYPPLFGNNMLFAEELALKASILASDYEVTPFGLGSLIFHGDSVNPFNGLSIRKILAKLDTAMSSYIEPIENPPTEGHCKCDNNFFDIAYRTIRMIDSAFCGPMDTLGQYSYPMDKNSGFTLKPVRLLADVPFLTVDSNFSSRAAEYLMGGGLSYDEPLHYSLDQNYPNPFNPSTIISFTLLQESYVTLKVYNLLGQEVATLLNREQFTDGPQEVEFNASNIAAGVYFYRIEAEGIADPDNGVDAQKFIAVQKMILLK